MWLWNDRNTFNFLKGTPFLLLVRFMSRHSEGVFFSSLHDMDIVATALLFLATSPAFWPKLKKKIEKLISSSFVEIEISTNMFLKVQKRKINLFTWDASKYRDFLALWMWMTGSDRRHQKQQTRSCLLPWKKNRPLKSTTSYKRAKPDIIFSLHFNNWHYIVPSPKHHKK